MTNKIKGLYVYNKTSDYLIFNEIKKISQLKVGSSTWYIGHPLYTYKISYSTPLIEIKHKYNNIYTILKKDSSFKIFELDVFYRKTAAGTTKKPKIDFRYKINSIKPAIIGLSTFDTLILFDKKPAKVYQKTKNSKIWYADIENKTYKFTNIYKCLFNTVTTNPLLNVTVITDKEG